MSSIAASRMTLEEFEQLDDTRGLELVDGVVKELDVGAKSTKYAQILTDAVEAHAAEHDLGVVVPNDVGVDLRKLGTDLLRKPDGMFVRAGRLPGGDLPDGWLEIVPDIAWEVVSPGDRVEALERKLRDYRDAAFPLVWVIFPATRSARLQDASGDSRFIDEEGFLDGGELLPGFQLRLGEIFERYTTRVPRLA